MNDGKGPGVLSSEQRSLLADVLDRIIPREGKHPGAGEVGVADHVDDVLGRNPGLRYTFLSGLAALDRGAKPFLSLTTDEKVSLLHDVEAAHPDFFTALVRETYAGYYSNHGAVEALGLDPAPPQPTGYVLEPFDFALLDKARKRGKIYKDVSQ